MGLARAARRLRALGARGALCACLLALMAAGAQAQMLEEIVVEGAQRIEADSVRSYMTLRVGDAITADALDASLKALFATGLFADVVLRQDGNRVIVELVENPIINRIAFEGNRRISDEVLRGEVQLRPRVVYTRARVQADTQRILDVYRRGGRFAATVEPKVIELPQNRVDLAFEINEGALTRIERIAFVGNEHFSDGRLRRAIQSKESVWWNPLATTDTYDPDRLTFDGELLRRHYLANGYADFRLVSVVAELTPRQDSFLITFTVEEGERYRFGRVDIATALRDLDPEGLRTHLAMAEGDWYDADALEDTITRLTEVVGNLGYAFVDVAPRISRDRDARTIDVTFDIQEGPRVFVERIEISGNVRTEDRVIRREMQLVEGDAFNAAKLRRSRQRINNLGFFGRVDVDNIPGNAPDTTVVNVEVAERSTGEVSFGAGYSSTAGLLGDIGLSERNLLGRGQDVRLGLRVGQREQQIDFSFTEPYFLNRELSAGVDLFRVHRDLQRESSFNHRLTGGVLRMGYGVTEFLRQTWRYTLRHDVIQSVRTTAPAIVEQEGAALTSQIGQTLAYDRRDDRFDPTTGYLLQWDADVAGLGGDVRFLRNELLANYYYPIGDQWIASVAAGGGYIYGIGERVRIIDRFFLGGQRLRGFAPAGVGPRDLDFGDSLGGNWFYRGSVQLAFPIGLPEEFGITGRAFSDFGSVGGVGRGGAGRVTDTGTLRLSVGVGLGWRSPFGPVSIDFGVPILKEGFDEIERFQFSFGTRF